MTELPEWMTVGAIVRIRGFAVGRIEDVLHSASGRVVVKFSAPKTARLSQSPDLLDYTATPDLWQPATLDDLRREASDEIARCNRAIEAIKAGYSE